MRSNLINKARAADLRSPGGACLLAESRDRVSGRVQQNAGRASPAQNRKKNEKSHGSDFVKQNQNRGLNVFFHSHGASPTPRQGLPWTRQGVCTPCTPHSACGGRDLRGHHAFSVRITVRDITRLAPLRCSSRAHSTSVEPVVHTSSISKIRLPATSSGLGQINACFKFPMRSVRPLRLDCGLVSLARSSR